MTLTINGRPTDQGPREDFGLDRDPLTDQPIDPPVQLELKPKPKTEGHFTKRAKALIGRHKRGGGKC